VGVFNLINKGIMNNNDKDELILFEDNKYRFVIFQVPKNDELFIQDNKQHVFFIRQKSNPLSSAWKMFDSELEAKVYGQAHILNYRSEVQYV
jgi:hypothetical protein